MCDRILIFGPIPGRVIAEIRVDLPQPRNRLDPAFRDAGRGHLRPDDRRRTGGADARRALPRHRASRMVLPRVSTNLMAGLIGGGGGRALSRARPTCRRSAPELHLDIDDLFPVAETLQLLRFAESRGRRHQPDGAAGLRFADSDVDERKQLVRPASGGLRAARRPYPPGARRAAEPPGAGARASATSWRTTCRTTTPRQTLKAVIELGPLRRILRL